jgi:hypothetical protein
MINLCRQIYAFKIGFYTLPFGETAGYGTTCAGCYQFRHLVIYFVHVERGRKRQEHLRGTMISDDPSGGSV